jgi:hypothetical protein
MNRDIQDERNEVLTAQILFWQALCTKDQTLFKDVLTPDFIARSPGEADQTREVLRIVDFQQSRAITFRLSPFWFSRYCVESYETVTGWKVSGCMLGNCR